MCTAADPKPLSEAGPSSDHFNSRIVFPVTKIVGRMLARPAAGALLCSCSIDLETTTSMLALQPLSLLDINCLSLWMGCYNTLQLCTLKGSTCSLVLPGSSLCAMHHMHVGRDMSGGCTYVGRLTLVYLHLYVGLVDRQKLLYGAGACR